jgi:hypothetical protein
MICGGRRDQSAKARRPARSHGGRLEPYFRLSLGIVGIYQRHDWADEKRAALAAWGTRVEAIVE